MTVLMTFVGIVVFFCSLITADFKTAFKRLWMFAFTGMFIDILIITVATVAGFAISF